MKEVPTLMSPPMVRALLDGAKTMTRRQLYVPTKRFASACADSRYPPTYGNGEWPNLPPGQVWTLSRWHKIQVGDKLWVRERFQPLLADGIEHWRANWETGEGYAISYPATDGIVEWIDADDNISSACKPSIHMPRWACRLLLDVVGVRVERLQEISEADAMAEGIASVRSQEWDRLHFAAWRYNFEQAIEAGRKPPIGPTPAQAFRALWESINGSESWQDNPWVVAIEFKVVTP